MKSPVMRVIGATVMHAHVGKGVLLRRPVVVRRLEIAACV